MLTSIDYLSLSYISQQWNPASVHELDEQLLDDIFFNPANLDRGLELTRWDQSSSL